MIVNDTGAGSNLNQFHFPENFFQESWSPIPTPVFIANEGEEVRFRVFQSHGRTRQSNYSDTGRWGKSGCYLYRDGPIQMFAGGVWGHFRVNPAGGDSLKCKSPPLTKGP